MSHSIERIEILSVALLDQHMQKVQALKRLARSLGLEFGWHYLLDLTWIISLLGPVKGRRILDAGAGTGILQWYLAEQGAEVISVDRLSRARLPLRFRNRYNVHGLRPIDLLPASKLLRDSFTEKTAQPFNLKPQARELAGLADPHRAKGRVIIYNQELRDLCNLTDASLDAVVALSALEHNLPEVLPVVVAELMRVLKPGGKLLATLGAACDADWLHAPSQGWCYTEASLRRLFDLSPDTTSNYDDYAALFAALCDCAELRDSLATFYHHSSENGMPWGRWDPQYQAVGVCKVKKGIGEGGDNLDRRLLTLL